VILVVEDAEMWNEAVMQRRPEDGRDEASAWCITLVLFAIMLIGSLVRDVGEPSGPGARSPAGATMSKTAR